MKTSERAKQRLQNFSKAMTRLRSACDQDDYSELEQAGLIQTFEFTFELGWKTMKDLLYYEGVEAATPRETTKKAFEAGYMDDADEWIFALDSRNLFSHAYNEQQAAKAVELIKVRFLPALQTAENVLKKRLLDG